MRFHNFKKLTDAFYFWKHFFCGQNQSTRCNLSNSVWNLVHLLFLFSYDSESFKFQLELYKHRVENVRLNFIYGCDRFSCVNTSKTRNNQIIRNNLNKQRLLFAVIRFALSSVCIYFLPFWITHKKKTNRQSMIHEIVCVRRTYWYTCAKIQSRV